MTLLQLRYFQAACKFSGITKAAESLHISQPSVSSAIKELENEFGLTLFYRQNKYKGMSLTLEGKQFLELVSSFLAQADNITQIMNDLGQRRNLVRLGIPPMIGSIFFPRIYRGFCRQYPEISISTQETGSKSLLDCLISNTLDVAFIPHNDPFPAEYQSIDVTQIETVYCVPKGHRFSERTSVTIQDINDEPLVMFKNSFYQNEVISQRFRQCGIKPNVLHYSDQLSTIREFIVSSTATGFMFYPIAKTIQEMTSIPLDPHIPIQISLVWLKNRYIYNDTIRFIDFIRRTKL